jgi:hypothetical protein
VLLREVKLALFLEARAGVALTQYWGPDLCFLLGGGGRCGQGRSVGDRAGLLDGADARWRFAAALLWGGRFLAAGHLSS